MGSVASVLRVTLLIAGASWLGGCHTYRLVERPEVGSIVRVRVPVRAAVVGSRAATESASFEGRLLDNGDTLTLATETRRVLGAYTDLMYFDTLRIATEQATLVEVREFSAPRSVLLGVAVAGGAALAAVAGFGLIGGSRGEDGEGGEPQTAVLSGSMISALVGLIFR